MSEKLSSVPLGKRLEELESESEEDIMVEMNETRPQKKLPKTGSLEVLLSQYLDTGDFNQIENVLNVDDARVPLLCVVVFIVGCSVDLEKIGYEEHFTLDEYPCYEVGSKFKSSS